MGTLARPALEDACIVALKAGLLRAVYCLPHLLFICIYLVPALCQELRWGLRASCRAGQMYLLPPGAPGLVGRLTSKQAPRHTDQRRERRDGGPVNVERRVSASDPGRGGVSWEEGPGRRGGIPEWREGVLSVGEDGGIGWAVGVRCSGGRTQVPRVVLR